MDIGATGEQSTAVDYFRPIWTRKWLIAFIVAIATVGTYVYYNGKPRVYAAAATLYTGNGSDVQSALGGGADSQDPDRQLADLSRLISSPPVVAAAEKLIGDPRILGAIQASPATDSDFIQLESTSSNPVYAAETVNAYAKAFIEFRTQSLKQQAAVALAQVQSEIASNKNPQQVLPLQEEEAELKLQESQPSNSIQQIAPAEPDDAPLSPNPKKDAIFALALSLLIGMALAYGLDRLDQRIRSEEELQPVFGVPVVGEIQQVVSPVPDTDGIPYVHRDQWESFRALRTNIELAAGSKPLRTILVASAQMGEGKSLVVRNLALAYADAGARVAIVEADLRRPTLAKLLHVEAEPGLTEVLQNVQLLPHAVQPVGRVADDSSFGLSSGEGGVALRSRVGLGTLDVVTAGAVTESLTAGVAAEGIKSVLARMTEEYDIVLVDSAPLLAVSDCVPLIGVVDGVVLVARVNTTTDHGARRLTELLGRVDGARVLGVVANGVAKRPFQYGSGYTG